MEPVDTILREWSGRELPELVERDIDLRDSVDALPPKITVVSGFRRTGKTCLALLLARDLLRSLRRDEVVYLNFEDERIPLRTEFLTDLLPSLRRQARREVKYLLLDEVQNIPDWSRWLRRIYDTEKLRLVVTGSSSKLSNREIPTELRGRFLQVKCFPLSFREFLRFRGSVLDTDQASRTPDTEARFVGAFNEYLESGGLPEIVLAPEPRRAELANSYYQTVVRRDIIERHRIRNEETLKALLRLLLNSAHYTVSRLHNSLRSLSYDASKVTLQHYLACIENSFFVHSLSAFAPGVKNAMMHPRKLYFIDNVFLSALSTRHSRNYGRLYENLAAVELLRRNSGDPQFELSYWKNPQHEEVDFVVRRDLRVEALIQVCYDLSEYDTRKRELRALVKAARELRCRNLLVLNREYEGVELHKDLRIRFQPLWKWLLTLPIPRSPRTP